MKKSTWVVVILVALVIGMLFVWDALSRTGMLR